MQQKVQVNRNALRRRARLTYSVVVSALLAASTMPTDVVVAEEPTPQRRTTFYRLDATAPAKIPPVVLSKAHEVLCKVMVGDVMPAIDLPELGGSSKKLAALYGKKATVIVFWKGDRRMAHTALADLGPDVIKPFAEEGIAVVGVAIGESDASAKAALDKAAARFPNLLDADGSAFASVGAEKLPRIYLIDSQGKILWFDIEYSQATRRELHQALRAVVGKGSASTEKQE